MRPGNEPLGKTTSKFACYMCMHAYAYAYVGRLHNSKFRMRWDICAQPAWCVVDIRLPSLGHTLSCGHFSEAAQVPEADGGGGEGGGGGCGRAGSGGGRGGGEGGGEGGGGRGWWRGWWRGWRRQGCRRWRWWGWRGWGVGGGGGGWRMRSTRLGLPRPPQAP